MRAVSIRQAHVACVACVMLTLQAFAQTPSLNRVLSVGTLSLHPARSYLGRFVTSSYGRFVLRQTAHLGRFLRNGTVVFCWSCFLSSRYDRPMWDDDLDWLELTYPVRLGRESSEAERAEEAERVCLRRLEAIWWPEGPTCPECGTCDDAAEWKEAPRGLGWRCRNCKARFHVLKAISPMTGTHQSIRLWFRAIFLISNSENLSPGALCKRLGLQYKNCRETSWRDPEDASRVSRSRPTHRKWARSRRSGAAEIQEAGPCDHTQAIR